MPHCDVVEGGDDKKEEVEPKALLHFQAASGEALPGRKSEEERRTRHC